MSYPVKDDSVLVVIRARVVRARVLIITADGFSWRAVTGGMGRCRDRDEGITWVFVDSDHADAFRTTVALS